MNITFEDVDEVQELEESREKGRRELFPENYEKRRNKSISQPNVH